MNSRLNIGFRYLKYWLNSIDQHSLQAPFVYRFYQEIVRSGKKYYSFPLLEQLRQKLLNDSRTIEITDYGAGSSVRQSHTKRISTVARYSSSSSSLSQMLFRIAIDQQPGTTIELGTSLGINTLYLAQANPRSEVVTFEGCPHLATIAKNNFQSLKQRNIHLIEGNIDETLPAFIHHASTLDLVYFDANHRYAPTLNYWEICLAKAHKRSIFIFGDIHWSQEMQRAWEEIRAHSKVSLSIDLFHVGILFFDPALDKQHYVLEAYL